MKKGIKAQAAMEFLMTYGWAILVVLVAIGALAYFGVLNPAQFLPSSCTITSGLGCDDFKVTGGDTQTAEVILRNGFGQDMSGVVVAIGTCGTDNDPALIKNGDAVPYSLTCSGLTAGSRFQEDLNVTYTLGTSSLSHTAQGTITTKIE